MKSLYLFLSRVKSASNTKLTESFASALTNSQSRSTHFVKSLVVSLAILFAFTGSSLGQTVVPFTTSTTWTCPAGVTQITVTCVGGGGAGGGSAATSRNGGGGGGGASVTLTNYAVTPGGVYTITVGAGGTGVTGTTGNSGGFSQVSYNSTVFIKAAGGLGGLTGLNSTTAGAGGAGGATANNIPVNSGFKGGNGGASNPVTTATDQSGGGGGGGGITGAGGNGGIVTAGVAGSGGLGGAGGAGVSTTSAAGSLGNAGLVYGGGGGGSTRWNTAGSRVGAAGAAGYVQISFIAPICSGTPVPGNTISSAATVTPGGTVNLSLQNTTSGSGVTYQWQSAPSSLGPWTNFGTSSANQTSSAINANSWFRCNVTCGGNTGSSNPVQVTLVYCAPSGTGANTSITNVVTSGGITNLSNASAFTAGGYANFTAQSCSQSAGGTINFTLTYVSDPGTKIFIDWNNDLDFNDAGENVYSSNAYVLSTVSGSFAVPVGQAIGNYRMRIVADWNSTTPIACPVGINGETEDYTFTVAAPPSCPGPTALVGTPITLTSATISWTAPSPAPTSGYQYYVSTSATSPLAGTTPTGTTAAGVTTANLSSLTIGTTYYFWVRSVCSVSDLSSWAGAGSFYVGYCVPVTTFGCTDGDVIARVVLNTLDNNSGTGCPSGLAGYSDYTTNPLLTTTLLPSSTYNCTVYAGQYGEGYAAWIDYNDDGVFDNATERIGYSNGQVAGSGIVGVLGSSAAFPITLACTPPAGTHRLRVRAMYFTNGVDVTPCTANAYGEVEDYLITIAPAPACPSPGLMSTLTPTSNSVALTWALGCSSASSYDFEYGPVGFTLGTGTLVSNQTVTLSAPNASYTLTGLQAGTNYDIYYRANCGSSTSAWSLTSNFTTLNGVSAASSTPTLCQGTVMTSITHNTQGATGIGTATGLPSGVTAAWSSNIITISGTPTVSGVFSYSIPLTGGVGSVNATGSITVLAAPSAPTATSPQVFCETANATIASLQVSGAVGSTFAWYTTATGGVALSNSTSLSIGTTNYFVQAIGTNGCVSLTRTSVSVTENPLLSASVSITGTTACPGGVLLFTATPVNGGTSPTYQWYNNGVVIPNETASTYSASGLLAGDVINVKMIPSGSCVTVCP